MRLLLLIAIAATLPGCVIVRLAPSSAEPVRQNPCSMIDCNRPDTRRIA